MRASGIDGGNEAMMSGSGGRWVLGARGKEQRRPFACRRTWLCASIVLLVVVCAPRAEGRQAPDATWTGTWATAPMHDNSGRVFHGQTLRQIVHTSVGGKRTRLRISNVFGTLPVQIEDVHIAMRSSGASIMKNSDCQVRFGGRTNVLLAPGATAVSDSIAFAVPPLADVAISFYLPGPTGPATFHASSHQTSYIESGDVSGTADMDRAETIRSNYFISGLDVQDASIRGAIVALGASITEGYSAGDDTNHRWPDELARRMSAGGLNVGVLNLGISGNRLLASGAGPSAESRFDRDVLQQPNVRWVIFSDDPINDLGSTKPPPSGEELIAGLRRLIVLAHEKDIQFLCSTLTPFEGANYWTSDEEKARETFNGFVRSQTSGCDAVVDQDQTTHDPAHPARYLAVYDSGDHLHPNDAGHKAIAGAVDLGFLAPSREIR
jgi:lysophospholipase L1-like esterase